MHECIDINVYDWINEHPNDLFGKDIKFTEGKPCKFIAQDVMFMGSVDVMGKWINMIPDVTDASLKIHSHFWLAETFLSLNLI